MRTVCALCAAAVALAGAAWGMGDREVIREYDYPRKEKVIEKEKIIIKEKPVIVREGERHHKASDRGKGHSGHPASAHQDAPKHHAPSAHPTPPAHHNPPPQHSGGQSSGHHHKK